MTNRSRQASAKAWPGVIACSLLSIAVSAIIVFVLLTVLLVSAESESVAANNARSAPPLTMAGASRVNVVGANLALASPEDFLDLVRSQASIEQLGRPLTDALIVAPRQVLEIVVDHPPLFVDSSRTLEELAVAAVAERDIDEALDWLASMPDGDRRRRLQSAIAAAWARQAPDDALAWAQGLEPPDPGMVAIVIGHSAASDPDTALSLLESFELPAWNLPAARSGEATAEGIAELIVRQLDASTDRARFADELLQRGTARSLVVLEELTEHWAGIDTLSATEWVVQTASRLPPELPVTMVGRLAATDATAAAEFADRLPAGMRALVAEPVASQLIRVDPLATINWIAQFRDQTDYRSLYRNALQTVASSDPMRAAALLAGNPPAAELSYDSGQPMLIETTVAEAWAARDEAAAAAWAQGLTNPEARIQAMVTVTRRWLSTDPERAQQWVLALPEGEARQRAVGLVLFEGALRADFETDPAIARAYGSGTEQQEIIRKELRINAQVRDPRRLLRLAREWIVDPEIQALAIAEIEEELNRYSTH